MALTNKDAMDILKRLRDRLDELRKGVKRKHWRPSEKAFAAAKYQMEVDAINKALIYMSAKELKHHETAQEGQTRSP